MEKAAYSLLSFHPLPSSYTQGERRDHRQQLLQAQGLLKSNLLVHGSRGRGLKMPSLSQNLPAALPTVVTLSRTPFWTTTLPSSFHWSSYGSFPQLNQLPLFHVLFTGIIKHLIYLFNFTLNIAWKAIPYSNNAFHIYICIFNMYFQLNNSQSLQIWILRKTYCKHMPTVIL